MVANRDTGGGFDGEHEACFCFTHFITENGIIRPNFTDLSLLLLLLLRSFRSSKTTIYSSGRYASAYQNLVSAECVHTNPLSRFLFVLAISGLKLSSLLPPTDKKKMLQIKGGLYALIGELKSKLIQSRIALHLCTRIDSEVSLGQEALTATCYTTPLPVTAFI